MHFSGFLAWPRGPSSQESGGPSWEGFAIENLLAASPPRTLSSFYRTSASAEIDLLLELPGQRRPWAIEIKRGLTTGPGKGFHNAIADIRPARAFVVHGGSAIRSRKTSR